MFLDGGIMKQKSIRRDGIISSWPNCWQQQFFIWLHSKKKSKTTSISVSGTGKKSNWICSIPEIFPITDVKSTVRQLFGKFGLINFAYFVSLKNLLTKFFSDFILKRAKEIRYHKFNYSVNDVTARIKSCNLCSIHKARS